MTISVPLREDQFGEALYDFEGGNEKELSFKVCIINSEKKI
jgi:hypothetical protein